MKKKIIKKSKPFLSYPRAHFFVEDDVKNGPLWLYKYMDIDVALKSLASGTLRFFQPSAWSDKWEQHFYTADYSNVTQDPHVTPKFLACCFTTNKISEAAWSTYKYGKQRSGKIMVKFTLSRAGLRKQILKDKSIEVYEGFMNYSLPDHEIQGLHDSGYSIYFNNMFEGGRFGLDSYLSLMLLKRQAFYYEKEFRFMIIDEEGKTGESALPLTKDIHIDWASVIKGVEIDEACKPGSKVWTDLQKHLTNAKVMNVSIKPVNLYEDPGIAKGPITIK